MREHLRWLWRRLGDLSLTEQIITALSSLGVGLGGAPVIAAVSGLHAGWIIVLSCGIGFGTAAAIIHRFANPSSPRLVPVYHRSVDQIDRLRYLLPGPGVTVHICGELASQAHTLRIAFRNDGAESACSVRCQFLGGRVIRQDGEEYLLSEMGPKVLEPVAGDETEVVRGDEVYYELLHISEEHPVTVNGALYRSLRSVNLSLPWRPRSIGLGDGDQLNVKVRAVSENADPRTCTVSVKLEDDLLKYDLNVDKGWSMTW